MPIQKLILTDPNTGRSVDLPVREGSIGPAAIDVSGLYRESGIFT